MRSARCGGECVFTIDASVWLNADSPAEPHHAESRAFLDLLFARSLSIIVPTWLAAEVAGAIARTRADPALAEQMATTLLGLPRVRWISLDEPLGRQAAKLAANGRLRGANSGYAAVALEYGCELVSFDREHLARLGSVVTTITPADALARLRAAGPP